MKREEILKVLKDCDHLDDAIMWFTETRLRSLNYSTPQPPPQSAEEFFNNLLSTDSNTPVDIYASKYSRHDLFKFAEAYANQPKEVSDEILQKAIDKWGVDAQLEMIIEECLELALALQKSKRLSGNMMQKEKNVIDEIADVKIMIKQAEKIFGLEPVNERVNFKMKRLEKRLNDNDFKLTK